MLTIITPTYNREKLLANCYQSLLQQTDKRFIWMVVDDGSTDDTQEMVNTWIAQNIINIVYLKKENGGKASALNLAFRNVTTEYMCCLDSDDTFVPHAVELALPQLEKVKNDNQCCGIIAVRSNPDGTPMGGAIIPQNCEKITLSGFMKFGTGMECTEFFKCNIAKQYSFPEFTGEKFVSPAWLDHEINRKYYFAISRDLFCVCEYQPDGLTVNKRKVIVKNPHGYTAVKRQSFEFSDSIRSIIKNGIMYDCGCIIGHDKDWLKNAPRKIWAVILSPFAWLVYLIRFKKLRNKSNMG